MSQCIWSKKKDFRQLFQVYQATGNLTPGHFEVLQIWSSSLKVKSTSNSEAQVPQYVDPIELAATPKARDSP